MSINSTCLFTINSCWPLPWWICNVYPHLYSIKHYVSMSVKKWCVFHCFKKHFIYTILPYWHRPSFVCSDLAYEICSGGGPSTYIYPLCTCYRVIADPDVRSVSCFFAHLYNNLVDDSECHSAISCFTPNVVFQIFQFCCPHQSPTPPIKVFKGPLLIHTQSVGNRHASGKFSLQTMIWQ